MAERGAFQWLIERERLLRDESRREIYSRPLGSTPLAVHILLPEEDRRRSDEPTPVLVFLHDGLRGGSSILQFVPHALYYRERGAISVLVDFRTQPSRFDESLDDVRTAIRFIRSFAGEWRFAADRVVLVGAGYGAALAGVVLMDADKAKVEDAELKEGASRPNAGILLSSYFEYKSDENRLVPIELGIEGGGGDSESNGMEFSLFRFIQSDVPPMLVVHGNSDQTVSSDIAADFVARMERKGNPCRFAEFEGRERGFYHFNVDPVSYEALLIEMDTFLDIHKLMLRRPEEGNPQILSWRESDY